MSSRRTPALPGFAVSGSEKMSDLAQSVVLSPTGGFVFPTAAGALCGCTPIAVLDESVDLLSGVERAHLNAFKWILWLARGVGTDIRRTSFERVQISYRRRLAMLPTK